MGQLGFYFDMNSCIGCRTCQVSCKDKNDLPIGTLYRQVRTFETGTFPDVSGFHFSGTCNHCENPACVAGCPVGAMYKTPEGPVLHDDELCIGCQACVNNCPYGVPKYLADLNITGKCDTCYAIRAEGGDPQCVSACPMRALEFGDVDELKKMHPDAVSISEMAFMPENTTNPSTLISMKDVAAKEAAELTLY